MRLAVMQPYFFPYIGYYQLIAAVDLFIVYDNVKYTKKGWINRNRILQNGTDSFFSLPLKGASDSLKICERALAADFNRDKLLNRISGAYRRAPYFAQTFPLVDQIVRYAETNLFRFLLHSIVRTCEYLSIGTQIRISSDIAVDHDLKNQNKVLALCKAVGADTYVNASGGVNLYSKETFREKGVDLKFVRSKSFEYTQYDDVFVPGLSIIDAMMFNPRQAVVAGITANFDLV